MLAFTPKSVDTIISRFTAVIKELKYTADKLESSALTHDVEAGRLKTIAAQQRKEAERADHIIRKLEDLFNAEV